MLGAVARDRRSLLQVEGGEDGVQLLRLALGLDD